jgi:hypothetical protein
LGIRLQKITSSIPKQSGPPEQSRSLREYVRPAGCRTTVEAEKAAVVAASSNSSAKIARTTTVVAWAAGGGGHPAPCLSRCTFISTPAC